MTEQASQSSASSLEPDGSSQFGFSAALWDAVHYGKFRDIAKEGTQFKVTEQWIEVLPHHSPWHITYNVQVQQIGP